MAIKTINSISRLDLQERLTDFSKSLHAEQRNQGLPQAYKDDRCTEPNQFIQAYPDGREELIIINPTDLSITKIKDL